MVTSGRFSLGEECTPYRITKYSMKDGRFTLHDALVHARKVPLQQLRQKLLDKHQKFMRPTSTEIYRCLCMWHDHATILKRGYILVTVHVLYDVEVFFTEDKYHQLHPADSSLCVQSEVEQPEVHILSCGSSSIEDQAALVGDQLSCVSQLKDPIQTESGIQVSIYNSLGQRLFL